MDKRLLVGLLVSIALNVMLFLLWRNCKNVSVPVPNVEHEQAMQLLEAQRDRHAEKAEKYEAIADSLLSEIKKVSKKSNKTKIEYVQDLNAWRALPDDARDERVQFFTKELAKVDSIAVW